MTPGIKPLVAGNWKMNGTGDDLKEIVTMRQGFDRGLDAECDALICVPATLLSRAAEIVNTGALSIGAEDCHPNVSGAHTGDISAEMIRDAGGKSVIVGHSERRNDHNENDTLVSAKAQAAWRAGLTAIICIGETEEERRSGETLNVLSRQIIGSVPDDTSADNTVIAYEPVWAIGTGLTPTLTDIEDAHAHIRQELREHIGEASKRMRILYGGSVKPGNAAEILAITNVDGALVGGASLKAQDFLAIAEAYRNI